MTTIRTDQMHGIRSAGGILDRIVQAKTARLEKVKESAPIEVLVEQAGALPARERRLAAAISRADAVNLIAEVKRRSPSKGVIRADFDPGGIAQRYAASGAAAISVLTEEDFFEGSLSHLKAVRDRVDLPLLRKDFIFDEYQLYEAVLAGASAVLLIVAILDDGLLARLIQRASELKLDALVEVHSADEMRRAARAGASIIGVNNRDLTTFKVNLATSIDLGAQAPKDAILVSESGINTGDHIRMLRSAGFAAFLVGEHLMRAEDPGDALARLLHDAD